MCGATPSVPFYYYYSQTSNTVENCSVHPWLRTHLNLTSLYIESTLTCWMTDPLQGSTALQLFPYGWDIKEGLQKGSVVREGLYKKIVLGRSASYFSWVNQEPADAFFSRYENAALPLISRLRCHNLQ